MQDIIHLLPDAVANQIAAGEVVQRPASVVKELMENAVDAGATKVQVVVVEGGRTLIQVIDNGSGMSETDARLAFERHATSKIKCADDLFALSTMGFRGEALASIVAVSQVELSTRRACDELGTRLTFSGSQLCEQETVACDSGSNFKVKNLFFNIPARRKFLKSVQTEFNNIVTEFERVALAHCDIEFSLRHNDNDVVILPASSFRNRILNLFGKKVNSQLVEVEIESSLISIKGYVGTPESSRKKGALQYLFVNGRYMRHPYFAKAVTEAYSELIPPGELIPFFLNFTVDPSRIDVNIHPTKTEIKFEDEQGLWKIIAAAVREALGRFNATPGLDFDTDGMPDIPTLDFSESDRNSVTAPKLSYNPSYNPFKRNAPEYRDTQNWEALYEVAASVKSENSSKDIFVSANEPDALSSLSPAVESVEDYTPIAQYKGEYILVTTQKGLMFVNQRRAHVRILYDKYIKQMGGLRGNIQGLLFPERLEFTVNESVVLDSLSDELASLGFEISSLGAGSYVLQGVPLGIDGLEPASLLTDIIHSVLEQTTSVREKIHDRIALSMAKKVAIVAGQLLSSEEMQSLVEQLFRTSQPARTPDGKTITYVISDSEIDRAFLR